MATENDQDEGEIKKPAVGLRVIAVVILFPFLWIGVAVNFLDIAERFAFMPGISREGGVVSGLVALLLTAGILGVVVGGASAVAGGGFPISGGNGEGAAPATPAKTPTTTITPTATPTPTPNPPATPIPTSTPESMTDLERFEAEFRGRINISMENDSYTGIPILATEYRKTEDGKTELWLVYWECDEADPLKDQRFGIGANFINTVGPLEGEQPDQLRVYGVTNLKNYEDTITYITTSSAERYYNNSTSYQTYIENWYERQHEPTQSESGIAYQMVVNESGEALADKAFKEHHKEVSYCPGGASPGGQSDDSSARISAPGSPVAAEPVTP